MYGSHSGQKQAMEYWVPDGKNKIDYLRANNWGPTLTLTKVFQSKVFKVAKGRVWPYKIHSAYKINIRKTLASQILILSIHPSIHPSDHLPDMETTPFSCEGQIINWFSLKQNVWSSRKTNASSNGWEAAPKRQHQRRACKASILIYIMLYFII